MEEKTKSIFSKLFDIALLIAASSFLIRLGIGYILDVWPALAIIVTLIAIVVIIYRIWKRKNDENW